MGGALQRVGTSELGNAKDPLEGIRYWREQGRLQKTDVPTIRGRDAESVARGLRSIEPSQIGPIIYEVRIQGPEVVTVTTDQENLVFDLREGARYSVPTGKSGEEYYRAIHIAASCAAQLVEYHLMHAIVADIAKPSAAELIVQPIAQSCELEPEMIPG